jgi:hypothetical protein
MAEIRTEAYTPCPVCNGQRSHHAACSVPVLGPTTSRADALAPPPDQPMPERCHAAKDGECWEPCPQLRDGEPATTGRHCPVDQWSTDGQWEPDRTEGDAS